MKQKLLFISVFSLIAGIHLFAGSSPNSAAAQQEKMQWWRNAKFGMFIHYGLYSGPEGKLNGIRYKNGVEWIQFHTGMNCDCYARKTTPLFRPAPEAPASWAALAAEAGCRYTVLTAKHHEGFSLFDSALTDFDSYDLIQRDIVDEWIRSCREKGLKPGLYYSVIDWHHPSYDAKAAPRLPYPAGNRLARTHRYPDRKKYAEFVHGQATEIMKKYNPDIIWWDYTKGDGDYLWNASELLQKMRTMKPSVIMNNRLYEAGQVQSEGKIAPTDSDKGDFSTPEEYVPEEGLPDNADWEVCMTLNGTWGYSAWNKNWKPFETVLRALTDTVSKGGNFLLNIGPRADGSIPEEAVTVFRQIGAWMRINGEAVYGTRRADLPKPEWGVYTRKGSTLYALVYRLPKNGTLAVPVETADKTVSVTRTGSKTVVAFERGETGLCIPLKATDLDSPVTVFKIENAF